MTNTQGIDWDQWRRDYDTTPYLDQLAFYDDVYRSHPEQKCHTLSRAQDFFSHLPSDPLRVIEVGGWRGELASEIIPGYPNITKWTNYEVCRGAVEDSVLSNEVYRAVVATEWLWERKIPLTSDVFVACHVIEHMKFAQLRALLDKVTARWAYFEAPLLVPGQTWDGYMGTHINEAGWPDILSLMEGRGWALRRYEVMHEGERETLACASWERWAK